MFNVLHQFHKTTFLVCKNEVYKADSDSECRHFVFIIIMIIEEGGRWAPNPPSW